MSDRASTPDHKTAVLGWTVPRPTGRWHRAIVITNRHLWITPELTFGDNEKLLAAAAVGDTGFVNFVRAARWTTRPSRCALTDIQGLQWNSTTGSLRVACINGEMLAAQIPDRSTGTALEPRLRAALTTRRSRT